MTVYARYEMNVVFDVDEETGAIKSVDMMEEAGKTKVYMSTDGINYRVMESDFRKCVPYANKLIGEGVF